MGELWDSVESQYVSTNGIELRVVATNNMHISHHAAAAAAADLLLLPGTSFSMQFLSGASIPQQQGGNTSPSFPSSSLPFNGRGRAWGYNPPEKFLEFKMLVGEFLSILDITINTFIYPVFGL